MNIYLIALLLIIIGGTLFGALIELLNLSQLSSKVPDEFKEVYPQDKYEKSQAYLKENTVYGLIKSSLFTIVFVTFLFLGGFNWIDLQSRSLGWGPIPTGLVFVGILSLLGTLFSLPFSYYHTFVIEEKFGFNKMTLKTFIGDLIKGLVLGAILGGIVLAGIFWFFQSFETWGWLIAWGALIAFQLFITFLAPVTIMPLFNKFIPLEDGKLKDAIKEYAKKENFVLQGIFKMDGSKRSTKANAFFTGFGRFRRVVLFDTLIEKQSVEELVAVLAHEIGHFKKKHIFKQLVVSSLQALLMFFLLSFFLKSPEIFEAFRMDHISVYAGIVFFGIFYSPISGLLSLISLHMSRTYEFEADEYSLKTYPKTKTLSSALKKLSVENLSNLYPHPLKVFFEYTHPPILKRLEHIKTVESSL